MSASTSSAKKGRPSTKASAKSEQPLPVQLIALDDIDPSPLNRDSRNIDELVASVREHGVQQPIKLRPQGARFEIVYGERRFRAAKKTGLKAIPATVEKLTDEEAHELRIVENACRENPHPMEEAEAYEDLLAMKDARGKPFHTAESLAKLIGRSAQYVYARLKLTALGPAMRKAFWDGELTISAAFLVARAIPLALQDEALVEFREAFADGEEGAAFPTEDLAHLIEQKYLTRLDRAPFSMKDAKLVPEAGPCTSCPKRSGNQPALFPDDTPKDTCTDAVCFRSKLSAHRQKLAEDVVEKGGVVLTEHQSNEIYKGTVQLPWNSKYVDADVPCYDDPERRTWRRLLGDLWPETDARHGSDGRSPRAAPQERGRRRPRAGWRRVWPAAGDAGVRAWRSGRVTGGCQRRRGAARRPRAHRRSGGTRCSGRPPRDDQQRPRRDRRRRRGALGRRSHVREPHLRHDGARGRIPTRSLFRVTQETHWGARKPRPSKRHNLDPRVVPPRGTSPSRRQPWSIRLR